MDIFASTHIGYVKKKNEDRYGVSNFHDGALLIVADGVGGNIAGHHAAKKVVETLAIIDPEEIDPEACLKGLIEKTHEDLLDKVDRFPKLEGMGATASAVFLKKDMAFWAHVGDSRLYKIENDSIEQVTKDHTMAQFLLDEGAITVDDEGYEQSKNFLVQCVGGSECEVDSGKFKIGKGVTLLLSSDGLHDFLDDNWIHKTVVSSKNPEEAVNQLTQDVLSKGAEDNITIIVVKI